MTDTSIDADDGETGQQSSYFTLEELLTIIALCDHGARTLPVVPQSVRHTRFKAQVMRAEMEERATWRMSPGHAAAGNPEEWSVDIDEWPSTAEVADQLGRPGHAGEKWVRRNLRHAARQHRGRLVFDPLAVAEHYANTSEELTHAN